MARYLLDTDALIDFSKGAEPTASFVVRLIRGEDDVGLCPINVAEFLAGIAPEHVARWLEFIDAMSFWPISQTAAIQAAAWSYQFARRGVQLSISDTLVAAVVKEQAATIVTRNVRDYPMDIPLWQPDRQP